MAAAIGGHVDLNGVILKAVEAEETAVVDGNSIHDQAFDQRVWKVIGVQGFAHIVKYAALIGGQVGEKEVVGGIEAVFEGVLVRAGVGRNGGRSHVFYRVRFGGESNGEFGQIYNI